MQTSARRKKAKSIAQHGPLKVVGFKNPSGTMAYRVTGTVFGMTVKKNYRTVPEAIEQMEAIFRELTGGKTLEEYAPTNSFRTALSRESLTGAEEAERRLKPYGLTILAAANIAIDCLRQKQSVRGSPRTYLVECLRELGFGAEPERETKETDESFARKKLSAERDRLFLTTGTDAQLAAALFARTLSGRNVLPKTVETYRYVIASFLRVAGIATIGEITQEKIFSYITRDGVSTRTQKDQRARLFGFCRHLVKWKLLAENPVSKIDPIRHSRQPIVYPSVGTIERTVEIFATWMPRGARFPRYAMLPRFLLYAFSPLRPEEIGRLNPAWKDFNFATGTVQIVRTKSGGENVTVNLDGRLVAVLRDLADRKLTPNFIRRAVWEHWLSAGGIPSGIRDVLRHGFATYSYAVNPDKYDLARRMSNSVGILERHYINTSAPKEHGAAYFTLLEKVSTLMNRVEVRYVKSGPAPEPQEQIG